MFIREKKQQEEDAICSSSFLQHKGHTAEQVCFMEPPGTANLNE
jgi:hypothetical protein